MIVVVAVEVYVEVALVFEVLVAVVLDVVVSVVGDVVVVMLLDIDAVVFVALIVVFIFGLSYVLGREVLLVVSVGMYFVICSVSTRSFPAQQVRFLLLLDRTCPPGGIIVLSS